MKASIWVTAFLLLLTLQTFAQDHFTYTPQNPKRGDVITIYYTPSGKLQGTAKPIEAAYYMFGFAPGSYKNLGADNITLKKEGKQYTGTLPTDTAAHFIYFGFSADQTYDNNGNKGYYILLEENGNVAPGAHMALGFYYQYDGPQVGLERDPEKAFAALEKEMELYPSLKKEVLPHYIRLLPAVKKEAAPELVQKEIESFLKDSLKTEEDYAALEAMYTAAKLSNQAKLVREWMMQKYPDGKWAANEAAQAFFREKDVAKKEALLKEMEKGIGTKETWKHLKNNLDFYKLQIPKAYAAKKDWAGLRRAMQNLDVSQKELVSDSYNNIAWNMQGDSTELALAEELSRSATQHAKAELTKPSGKKPLHLTTSDWKRVREDNYALYADTYAMIMYRMGQYKKGLAYAKEAALDLSKGKDAEQNNTYALLAEKALPAKQLKKELETFVKNGAATKDIKDILRKTYIAEKGNANGFDDYIAGLQQEATAEIMAKLRKSMINEAAPSFALMDLSGNKVTLADLKGKVVVADFWATWCGPCISSFPAMQKMVNQYKANKKVAFVFINTWENNDDKKKLVQDFITKSQYNFKVLMDEDDKVVTQFKVEGIPTKFIIDGNGMIRFKSVGYNSSEDAMMAELKSMIELAANNGTKAF